MSGTKDKASSLLLDLSSFDQTSPTASDGDLLTRLSGLSQTSLRPTAYSVRPDSPTGTEMTLGNGGLANGPGQPALFAQRPRSHLAWVGTLREGGAVVPM